MQMLANQHAFALKKYSFEMLKERYPDNEEILTRLCSSLVTESDMQAFAKLMVDLYECGFMRCLDENKSAMEAVGYKMTITPPKQNPEEGEKIFPN
jgi:hypothetical protein